MTKPYGAGTRVKWGWGNGTAKGEIDAVFTGSVTCMIEDSMETRNADPDNPAYLIQQDDGGRVLKSHGEVREA